MNKRTSLLFLLAFVTSMTSLFGQTLKIDSVSCLSSEGNAGVEMFPEIERELKIKKVKKAYSDMYFIYATCNDTLYKILSPVINGRVKGEKIKKGKTYKLTLRSVFAKKMFGVYCIDAYDLHVGGTFYHGHIVFKEPLKGITNIYECQQLDGNRIIGSALRRTVWTGTTGPTDSIADKMSDKWESKDWQRAYMVI